MALVPLLLLVLLVLVLVQRQGPEASFLGERRCQGFRQPSMATARSHPSPFACSWIVFVVVVVVGEKRRQEKT